MRTWPSGISPSPSHSCETSIHERGITTVADVAGLTESVLVSMLGRASGRHLHALAHNRDPRPVTIARVKAYLEGAR